MRIGWISYLRMLLRGRQAVQEAVAQAQIVKNIHSRVSWKSTEFWCAVLTGLGAVAAQAGGLIPAPYGQVILAMSTSFYAISRGLAKSGDPLGGVKPGAATSEFWAMILACLGQMSAAASGAVSAETAAILAAISSATYGASRGLAKGGSQPQE